MNKYKVVGPIREGNTEWYYYAVIGPRGGEKSGWYTKSAALKEAKRLNNQEKVCSNGR